MAERSINRRLLALTSVSGLGILASLVLYWEVSRAWFVILALFAIGYLVRNRPRLGRDEWLFCGSVLIFFVAALVSHLANASPARGPQVLLETYLLLVFAIPLLFLYARVAPDLKIIWVMFVAAAMAAGMMSIVGEVIDYQNRAGGSTGQAVLFGTMAVALSGVAMLSYRVLRAYNSWGRAIFVITLLLSLSAVILSGSRGAWIGFFAVATLMATYLLDRYSLWQKSIVILIVIIAVPLMSYQLPLVKKRVTLAVEEIAQLTAEDPQAKRTRSKSIALRLHLWRSSIDIFGDNIVFGVGPGNFKPAMKQYLAEKGGPERMPRMKHAHNQYLNTLMTKGLVGMAALLLMLAVHLYIFVGYLKPGNPREVRDLAMAACGIITTFIVLGLTSAPLERKITLVFYGFSLALLLGQILFLKRSDGSFKLNSDAREADPGIAASDA